MLKIPFGWFVKTGKIDALRAEYAEKFLNLHTFSDQKTLNEKLALPSNVRKENKDEYGMMFALGNGERIEVDTPTIKNGDYVYQDIEVEGSESPIQAINGHVVAIINTVDEFDDLIQWDADEGAIFTYTKPVTDDPHITQPLVLDGYDYDDMRKQVEDGEPLCIVFGAFNKEEVEEK